MRSELRLSDLKNRGPGGTDRLMNCKIPAAVAEQIAAIAEQLGVSKTDVIVALLNEGLERAGKVASRPAARRSQRRSESDRAVPGEPEVP